MGTLLDSRRRHIRLPVLAVLLWLFASATHLHPLESHDAPGQPVSDCAVCLTLPGGAPVPVQFAQAPPLSFALALLEWPATAVAATGSSSSYLSRAPPYA